MSYTFINFKTKKALKEAIKNGTPIKLMNLHGHEKQNGVEYVEGPHYPKLHTWYAKVIVKDGFVVRVIT